MKRLSWLAAVLLLLSCAGAAGAERLELPGSLETVSAQTFEGCASLEEIVCPDGLKVIGEKAFADCPQLASITIPASVSSISADALPQSERPLLVRTSAGSEAMRFAQANQLDYQADTVYRALLIGQSNYQTFATLQGTLNDVQSMRSVLSLYPATPYITSVKRDLTAAQLLEQAGSHFADAKEQDVSLLFYAGHGASDGSLVGIDGGLVTAAQLRACLDQIPGRKILIIDACYSGALIGRSAEEADASAFTSAFLSAFAAQTRGATLAADSYFVMTAASGSQNSAEIVNGSKSYGIFTTMLAKGCGYNYLTGSACSLYADLDGDSVLTFDEAYRYAGEQASKIYAKQSAQVWPEECAYFGFLRK